MPLRRRAHRKGPRALVGLAWTTVLAAGLSPAPAAAVCNLIPAAVEELRSTLGTVDRPVATPGATVTVRADLACNAAAQAFSPIPAENTVALVFDPPNGGPERSVTVPVASVSVANCSPERCDTLRFVLPDTDADLPPVDGLGRTGPARIEVRRSNGVKVAEIGPLYQPAISCEPTPAETLFRHFIVLPPANDFADLTTKVQPRILATLDGGGNLLIPFDFRSVLPGGAGAPVARIVQGVGRVVAFTSDPQQKLVEIPSPRFVRAFSPIGRPVPPILQVADDGAVIFGSVDADESVFRIARREPGSAAAPAIFELSDRLFQGAGPILISDFDLVSREAAPLESLTASGGIVSLARDERVEGGLNPDLDTLDRVVQVIDGSTGTGSNTGKAVLEVIEGAVAKPALVSGFERTSFLESERAQGQTDANGDGDSLDDVLRVFDRTGLDRTRFFGPGEPIAPPANYTVDPEPAINGRALYDTGAGILFRSREADGLGKGTTLVSVSTQELQAALSSDRPDVSSDGRFVAFESPSPDLVPNDGNGATDVFVRDVLLGTTERASTTAASQEVQGSSNLPSISGDGQWVAWSTFAVFDGSDENGRSDVYVRRRNDDIVFRASVSHDGAQESGDSSNAQLSRDGRFVAFESSATNLVPGNDLNGTQRDVFRYDQSSGSLQRMSENAQGQSAVSTASGVDISADGRFVIFTSTANNLVPGDTNGQNDVFIKDASTGAIDIASRGNGGILGDADSGGIFGASVSADGRFVAFASRSTVFAGVPFGAFQVYVYDRVAKTVKLLSRAPDGAPGNASATNPRISEDGRKIAFVSAASNLVTPDINAANDYFVADRVSGVLEKVSVNSAGQPGGANNVGFDLGISGDGTTVAFESSATNLVPNDANVFVADIFLRSPFPGFEGGNGDGDGADSILSVYDPFAGNIGAGEQRAVVEVSADGALAGVLVSEPGDGADYNGDGDRDDRIAAIYDASSRAYALYATAAGDVSFAGSRLCFTLRESDQAGIDQNGDGDAEDDLWAFVDVGDGSPTLGDPVQAAGQIQSFRDRCLFLAVESGLGGSGDLNGDGDSQDRVFFDAGTNTGRAAEDFLVTKESPFVAVRSCEVGDGNTVGNADGDTSDCVMWIYDAAGGSFVNTGYAARVCNLPGCDPFFEPYRIAGNTVSFLVLESDQAGPATGPGLGVGCLASSPPGGCDLTGDGDSADDTIVVFNVASGEAQVFEIAPPAAGDRPVSPFPEVQLGNTVLNVALTEAQAGVDVNDDGVLGSQKRFFFLVGDSDGDGAFDYSDAKGDTCRETANAAQTDADGDGLGDGACDPNPASVLPGDAPCDVDRNGGIDRKDVDLVFRDRGTAARTSDARDADGDGRITVLDAAVCADRCTNPDCAPVTPGCGLLGLELLPLWGGALALRLRRRRAGRGAGLAAAAIAAAVVASAPAPARAFQVSVEASAGEIAVGGETTVTIRVAGLAAGEAPSLRSYDLGLGYDGGVLEVLDVSFGGGLGDLSKEQVLEEVRAASGRLDLAAVSLLSSQNLHALQPEGFVLAELIFRGVAPGKTSVSFVAALFGDSAGASLAPENRPASAVIEVLVPEPASLVLLAAGLTGLAARRRRAHSAKWGSIRST